MKDIFDFISRNINSDTVRLKLSEAKKPLGFDLDYAVSQIEMRKKYAGKLKKFLNHPEFLFPDKISGEQATHQSVADYHAGMVKDFYPSSQNISLLDMTAGLGIDSFSFALKNIKVTSLEQDANKVSHLEKNASTLSLDNLKTLNVEATKFLKETSLTFDVIFVDPSRRDSQSNKVYNFHDCSPDIILNQELIMRKSKKVIIKGSPLLDITQTLKDFKAVESIIVAGVKGECKEVLIILDKTLIDKEHQILFQAINLDNEGNVLSHFSFQKDENISSAYFDEKVNFATIDDIGPDSFILEPSAMAMKLAPWSKICTQFNAKKFDKDTHLFISPVAPQNFPGRVTRFISFLNKENRKSLKGFPASVVSRNYPVSADQLRLQFKIKEGDKNFIYASRIEGKPVLLLSESIAG